MGSVALLCDATEATGLGHLSRCVALGEALVEAGASVTVVGAIADPFRAVLADSGIDLHPAVRPLGDPDALAERRSALVERGVDRVVVDSYAATSSVAIA